MIETFQKWAIVQALKHSKRTIVVAFIISLLIGSGVQFIILDDNVMNMLPKKMPSRVAWDDIVYNFQ